jgi:hypothetical protein
MQVSVPHATRLYTTLLAQNHAGSWSRFISQPLTMDLSPPLIHLLQLTLHYVTASDGVTVTSASVVATWSADDEESGDVTCSCKLGKSLVFSFALL